MDIKQRIFSIREALSLSQEAFGKRIGVTRSAVSNYESGGRNVTEQVIKAICREFNVAEDWLKHGKGEMFIETKSSFLASIASQYDLDEFDQVLLEAYLALPGDQRKVIKDFIQEVAGAFNSEDEIAATERQIDEEVESYRRELEAELKGEEKSSVLQDIEEKEAK